MNDLAPINSLRLLKDVVRKNDEEYRRHKGVYLPCPHCRCPDIKLSAEYSGHGGLMAYCLCLACKARGPEILIMSDETDADHAANSVRRHWNTRNNTPYVDTKSIKEGKCAFTQKLLGGSGIGD